LFGANVDSNLGSNSSSSTEPQPALDVNQLLLGQVNASMPLFNGFKLKNSIKASESMYEAQKYSKKQTDEEIGLQVVNLFSALYKAQQMTDLVEDNLKAANQRVIDFKALEENGIIARNDLLKSQLQVSNIQLSLENAKKNAAIANYRLVNLLKLPENTEIQIDIEKIKNEIALNKATSTTGERSDLKILEFQKKASENAIKVAKSNYYPSLALTGGYIALDLNNVLTVTNAMNVGLGFSYDITSIFKNKKQVLLSENKSKEIVAAIDIKNEQIKEEVFTAQQNYDLSLKQSLVYAKAVEQTTENYRIVKDKYDNSLSTTNDLLDADYEQLQAKINQALSNADIAQKYYELQYASGNLINSLNINQK
jgi:outer membrane protein